MTRLAPRHLAAVACLAAACMSGWPGTLFAQQPEAANPPAPAADDAGPYLAREVIRLALLDLRAITQPTPDDYQAAHTLLSFAHDLDPKNADIVRRQLEASFNAGDREATMEHTRALILLDRDDTVAQLRFISDSIARKNQTAEQRLAAYEKFISSKDIDASIRSRLALDAALLLRERGDDLGFRQKLVQSMQLDSTHKEAAALGATVFSSRSPDNIAGCLDILVNLLKADPIDPNVHLGIARMLAAHGAYMSARRFHDNAMTISSSLGSVTDDMLAESRVLKWCTDGAAAVVQALDEAVAAEKDSAARDIERLIANKKPTTAAKKPEDFHLSAPLLAVSLFASESIGDRAAAAGKLKQLSEIVETSITAMKNPRTRGDVTDEQAGRAILDAMIQLNTIRLWANLDTEKFNENPEVLQGIRKYYPDAARALDGLWALRSGKPQETIELCKDLQDQRMPRVAMAMAYEALGDKEQAIAVYRNLMSDEPFHMAAAWARSRAMALGWTEDAEAVAQLDKLVADPRVPFWIDQMAIEPNRFLRVSAVVSNQGGQALDYFPVKLTIVNQSPIPLALGPDRPLNSRFVMLSKLERIGAESLLRPEVIDIDRRLRLMPQERLDVEVWPDPGQSGWLVSLMADRSVPIRWRFVQGFLIDMSSGFRPGPLSLTAETEAFVIRPLPDSTLSTNELADGIAASPEGTLRRFAGLVRARVLSPLALALPAKVTVPAKPGEVVPKPTATPAEAPKLTSVAGALVGRYATLNASTRAVLAVVVPHARLCPDMAPFDAAVRADQDPLVQCIVLSTRIVDPADPLLKAAKDSVDPRIRQMALAVESRLGTPAKLYARMTPDDFKPRPITGAGVAKE